MIRLTAHARDMIGVRHIDLAWIEAAIAEPDRETGDPSDGSLRRALKQLPGAGGRVLRVVYRVEGEDLVIITCFLDRGARR